MCSSAHWYGKSLCHEEGALKHSFRLIPLLRGRLFCNSSMSRSWGSVWVRPNAQQLKLKGSVGMLIPTAGCREHRRTWATMDGNSLRAGGQELRRFSSQRRRKPPRQTKTPGIISHRYSTWGCFRTVWSDADMCPAVMLAWHQHWQSIGRYRLVTSPCPISIRLNIFAVHRLISRKVLRSLKSSKYIRRPVEY